MRLNMWKWNAAIFYGLLLILINYYSVSSQGYDYDYEDQKDSWTRCPWIRNKLKNGRVRIRSRGRIAKFSCKSGYTLVGKRFATCVRGQWNNPIPLCITKGCPKVSALSNGHVSELNQGAQLSFDCGPGYSLFGESSIYCDGKEWDNDPPTCQATTLHPKTSCDFEDPDLCGWTHDTNHHFDWKRHQFQTPSFRANTGPSYDHTFGEGKAGYYMYIEASSPRNKNDTARLFSPVYLNNYSPGCFVFWYHMYGDDMGTLRVYFMPASSIFGELNPSWEKQGNQGNQWFRANITVPPMNENFQLIIEGIIGKGHTGDAAIDDVSLFQSDCNSLESMNSTESAEALPDSCRGRCHEHDTSTSCGCTNACESSNTCCSDYSTLCVTESTSSSGEDESREYLTTSGMTQIYTRPEFTPEENVGTVYTVTPEILDTESIVGTMVVTPFSESSTRQSPITVVIPMVGTLPVSTIVTDLTTHESTVVIPTGPSSSVATSTVSAEQTSVSTERNEAAKVTTQSPLTTTRASTATVITVATTNTPLIVVQASRSTTTGVHIPESTDSYIAIATNSETTSRASTFTTLPTSTPSTSSTSTPRTSSTSTPSTLSTSTTTKATTEMLVSRSASTSVPAVEITTSNTVSRAESFVPSRITGISTILPTVSRTMESKTDRSTLMTTGFIVSSTATSTARSTRATTHSKTIPATSTMTPLRTTPPVLRTLGVKTTTPVPLRTLGVRTTTPVTLRTLGVRTTPRVTLRTLGVRTTPPVTLRTLRVRTTSAVTLRTVRPTPPTKSKTVGQRTTQPVISRTGFVSTTPLVKIPTTAYPRWTPRKKFTLWKTTSWKFSVNFGSTTEYNRITKTSKKPLFSTTESELTSYSSKGDSVHAAETTADMHSGHGPNVIGIYVGVAVLLVLVGAVAFVFFRRRRMKNKLHDDSEIRFLPDSEVIEYSDACALDPLGHS